MDEIWDRWVALLTDADTPRCDVCGGPLSYTHDHKPDLWGLDDGPYLPGCAPRKKPDPKPAHVNAEIKARAWATRRAKYGQQGHR